VAPAGRTTDRDFDFASAAAALTDAAARAGAAIMGHFQSLTEVELKSDQSPVTRADKDSEAIILAALAAFAPHIPVVSEEAGGTLAKLGTRFFLVDPLDGTREFIDKRTDFTINIALVEDGRPRFGLVYAPARALLALTPAAGVAVKGELRPDAGGADFGALHPTPIKVRAANPASLTAVVSHSHNDAPTEAFLAKLNIAERSSAGSAVKFLAVAEGRADVYPRFGPTMEWDTAAGHAVLEAAGGRVETVDGTPLRYGKVEAALRNPGFVAWGPAILAHAEPPGR
jgi:3'(2'), 5'-bisphosphate nucleotidase